MMLKTLFLMLPVFLISTIANAQMISVNFHVGNDADAQDSHVFDGTETAGLPDFNTAEWNNVDVGNGGGNAAATEIFAPVMLSDDSGNATTTMLSSTLVGADVTDSEWFGGYAFSAASDEGELPNGISDDNLFNSYLALNGPNGDGTPLDSFVLDVTGVGAPFTTDGYDLIIYSDTDRRSTGGSNNPRTSNFTVTEAGGAVSTALVEDDNVAAPLTRDFNGEYILSDGDGAGTNYSNYTVISGLTASSFSLEVSSPGNGGRGGISGFQIVISSDEPYVLKGNVNMDGEINFLDIPPFIMALIAGEGPAEADCNCDGEINFLDILVFVFKANFSDFNNR